MIYFDNSATTKPYPEVIETMGKVMAGYYGNPSSLHQLGVAAHELLEAARSQVAEILGCQAHDVFFTSSGTESNNWAIRGSAYAKREMGRHLITSQIEHPSVLETFKSLEEEGFTVTYLPVNNKGLVTAEVLEGAIRPDTTLVSIIAVNNEVGYIQDIKSLSRVLASHPNILFHVDGVQSLGETMPSLLDLRVDMMSFSAHKFKGPRGVGILYKKRQKPIKPLLNGGGQERKLRSATENLAGIVATAKAMRLIMAEREASQALYQAMQARLREFFATFPEVQVFSPLEGAGHILTLGIPGVRGEVLLHALEEADIYVSTTSACSSSKQQGAGTLLAMGYSPKIARSAIRLSFGVDNTLAEIERFIVVFSALYEKFKKIR